MIAKLPPKDPRELGLFRFFVSQKVFINILFVIVFIMGLVLWFGVLNREAFGNFDFDVVTITTPYPGATAEEVEQLVTLPLENAIKNLEGIDEMMSVSIEALSLISIQIDPDASDKRKIVRSIEREVDTIRTQDLPNDGDEPQVVEITAGFPVLRIGVSGDIPPLELRDVVEVFEEDLLAIDGVSRVGKNGFKDKEIWVEADLKKLRNSHMSLWDLIDSVRNANHTSPGGRLEIQGREILVRTLGKLETAEDVKKVVVRSNESGRHVFIEDLAHVEERLERERKFTRLNGNRSIELNILKKDSGDTLNIDKEIRKLVLNYEKRYPDLTFAFADEVSFYINRRLKVLIQNGTVGMILVLIIMFLFLKPITAFWSTTAIPFAFLGGIITLWALGMSINMLTMFAFILVSGMLVDNGIVVAEYIEKKREEGIPTFTAAAVGVSEMSMPVFAAALTTIIAFAPLAFMEGIIGKFLRQMPIVLVACLLSDLFECLFILPGHLHHYDWKISFPKWIRKVREGAQKGLGWLTRHYDGWVGACVRTPIKPISIILAIFLVLLFMSKRFLPFEFFPGIVDVFVVKFELPVGATLAETEKIAIGFEDIAKRIPADEVESIITQVGSSGDHNQSESGTNIGEIRVFFNKTKPDRADGKELIESIRGDVETYAEEMKLPKVDLDEVKGGPPSGRAIEVQLIGDDFRVLNELGEVTQEFLKGIDGTIGIISDFDQGKDELQLYVDRKNLAQTGVAPARVAAVIRAAFDGEEATEIKRVGEKSDIKVKVKLPEEDREKQETVDLLTVTSPRGKQIPVKLLVNLKKDKGILRILRSDGKRTVTIRGGIDKKLITSTQVNKKIKEFLDSEIDNYPGVVYKFAGEQKNQRESLQSLLYAVFIALGLIYLVLATLFHSYWEPLLILSIIPFALAGIFLSLLIKNDPITFLVLIGFAGLTGVVVNNSILLIDTYNRFRDQKQYSFSKAVHEGSIQRLRPILLTSFSTFFGVMPLGLGIGGREPFLEGMAYSFGMGLLFCSFITIFWIPSAYMVCIKIKRRNAKLLGWGMTIQPAGIFGRAMAHLFDGLILLGLTGFGIVIMQSTNCFWCYWPLLFFIWPLYLILFQAGKGKTIGQKLMGLKIFNKDHRNISFIQALVRNLVPIFFLAYPLILLYRSIGPEGLESLGELSSHLQAIPRWFLPAFVGWIAINLLVLGFSKNKRSLHDWLAGTAEKHVPKHGT